MLRQLFISKALLVIPAVLLMSVPAFAVTVTINSSATPASLPEPGQTIQYGGQAANVTPAQSFALGSFQSVMAASQSTTTPSFNLTLTESLDSNSLVFAGSVSVGGTQANPVDTVSFTGTGTETFNGVTYATIKDGAYIFGVEQSNPINFAKGTPVLGLLDVTTPEPSTYLLSGLGFLGLAFAGWRRRAAALDVH